MACDMGYRCPCFTSYHSGIWRNLRQYLVKGRCTTLFKPPGYVCSCKLSLKLYLQYQTLLLSSYIKTKKLTGRLGIFCSLAQKYEEEKQLQLKLHRHGFSLLCSFLQYIHDSRYFKSHKLFLNSENAEPEVKDSIGLRNCFLQYFEKIYEENI